MKVQINAQVQYVHESRATTLEEAFQNARDALDFDMESGGGTVVSIQEEIDLSDSEENE